MRGWELGCRGTKDQYKKGPQRKGNGIWPSTGCGQERETEELKKDPNLLAHARVKGWVSPQPESRGSGTPDWRGRGWGPSRVKRDPADRDQLQGVELRAENLTAENNVDLKLWKDTRKQSYVGYTRAKP